MKAIVAAAGLIAITCTGLGWEAQQQTGHGWDDESPAGHSRLATHLAGTTHVAVLQSSLALLPKESGRGDALLLFATTRAPSPGELTALGEFVDHGGTLIVAADGGHANSWLDAVGGSLHGLPPFVTGDEENPGCLEAQFDLAGQLQAACLPSPTLLPDQTQAQTGGRTILGRLASPVGIDIDGDGELSRSDQPPATYPVAYQWNHSEGQVILVADGDLWTNRAVQDSPDNLVVARLLVAQASTTYLDGTIGPADSRQAAATGTLRALADIQTLAGLTMLLAILVLGVSLALQKTHRPWRAHRQDLAFTLPSVLAEATTTLNEALQDSPQPDPEPTP